MNLISIRRNIALFLVAIIVIVLAFRIAVAFIEVILLAICLAIIVFFGFAEDVKNAWVTIATGMQNAYGQWESMRQNMSQSMTKKKDAPTQEQDSQSQTTDSHVSNTQEYEAKQEK